MNIEKSKRQLVAALQAKVPVIDELLRNFEKETGAPVSSVKFVCVEQISLGGETGYHKINVGVEYEDHNPYPGDNGITFEPIED